MSMKLTPAFRLELDVTAPLNVGPTPTAGNRTFIAVTSGTVKGSEFDGEAVGPGGDWAVIGPDGYGKLDVRMHAKDKVTGEILYITYYGHLEATEGVMKVLAQAPDAKDQEPDTYNHRVVLNFETSGSKFAWVNRSIFVGKGSLKFDPSTKKSIVIYDVFRAE